MSREPLCLDCDIDIHVIGHYCMLTAPVWAQTGLGPEGGLLCLDCIEARIGRPLRYTDFRKCDVKGPRAVTHFYRRLHWKAARMLPPAWKHHLALRRERG